MKILNIDAFAAPKRALTVGGVDYPVKDMDVRAFIENIKLAEELEKSGPMTPLAQITMSIEMVKKSIPTLPANVVESFSVDQLLMVMQFVRGELDKDLIKKDAAAEGAAADAKS